MINKILYCLCLFWVSTSWAQPDQITVIGKGQREIEPAIRLLDEPKILDSIQSSPVPSYPMLYFQAPTYIKLDTIQAATIETSSEKLKKLYPFYTRIGIGTALMPLGELYFNSTRSRGFHYGLHTQHLSAFNTKITKQDVDYLNADFDRTNLTLFGNILEDNYKLKSKFNYRNDGFRYYGARKTIDTLLNQADSVTKQRFQSVGGELTFEGLQGDSAAFNYAINTKYNYFFTKPFKADSLTKWNNREHSFGINFSGWYRYQYETFYGDLGIRFNGFRHGIADSALSSLDSGLVTNNTIIDFSPGVLTQMFNNRLKVEVGAKLTLDIYSKTRPYLYPKVEVKYSMFNDIFIPYVGINGELKQISFRRFSEINPFIQIVQDSLRNENNLFTFYGGIKGTLSKRISFNAMASFGRHIGMGLFVNDSLKINTFKIVYDTVSVMKIEGSLSYQLDEKLKIDGIGRFYSYQTNNNAYAWNLPQLQFVLRGNYNLYKKFYFQLDSDLEFGRKTLVYDSTLADVTLMDGQYALSLKPVLDFNLNAEYRYNSRISAFLQFNNVATVRYNRYFNYPVQGFQVIGGITARF